MREGFDDVAVLLKRAQREGNTLTKELREETRTSKGVGLPDRPKKGSAGHVRRDTPNFRLRLARELLVASLLLIVKSGGP